jgi:hypothetical protein
MTDSENTSSEKNSLYLLHEKRLSDIMTSMYLAVIGANENAILLQKNDPWDIDPNRFKGSTLTRNGMRDLCEWLERLKIFAKDEETYRTQFLEPVRLIAKMTERYRNMDRRSTELEGWIFSKSKPKADMYSNEKKVLVSAVIPKLQTVMSVSVSESDAKRISSKYFVFGGCQPIGLVNRIHLVQSDNRQTQKKALLSEFDFLFTSYDDIKKIGRSIEMENFCEVESVQSEIKHHMGFPFVSFAKVLTVRQPQVVLKGIEGGKVESFQMSDHFYANSDMEDPKRFEGKNVRFFGVQWYSPRSKKAANLEKPELFLMQEEEDKERLRFEDLAGRIRLRCKMAKSEAEEILGKKIDTDDCIEIREDNARFRYSGSYDEVSSNFIQTMSKIRNLRENLKIVSSQVTEEQVIDEKKMNTENLVSLIKHFKELYDILLDYQMQFDSVGEYNLESAVSSLHHLPEGVIKRKISFLKYLGIFEQEKEVRITNKGFQILSLSAEEDLDRKFTSVSRGMIEIDRIKNEGIPPSVLLEHLRKGNVKGYCPVKLGNRKTEMYWTLGGKVGDVGEKIISKYDKLLDRVLEIMCSVSYPMTTQGISERTQKSDDVIGNFVVKLLLEETEKTGKIQRSGDSWQYTLEGRLRDLFRLHPDNTFDMNLIFSKISVGTMHEQKVISVLQKLRKEKVVSTVNGRWTSNTNMNGKVTMIANQKIREYVLKILEKKNMVDENRVRGLVEGALSKGTLFKNGMERKTVIAQEIANMINDGTITLQDGMFSKK